jgi:hypothetical protein
VIAVVGLPAWAGAPGGEGSAGGPAVDVAVAAHKRGAAVELVGKVGDDGAGDAVVVSLGRLGIGHAALLRDPARPTPVIVAPDAAAEEAASADDEATIRDAAPDPAAPTVLPADPAERPGLDAADIELALNYLPGISVVVIADPLPDEAVVATARATAFTGARLIVLVPAGGTVPEAAPEAIVLEAPERDDGSFGRLVGTFAGALEAGLEPAAAFREAVEPSGWERVGG